MKKKRYVLYALGVACLFALGALGGSLLSADAATTNGQSATRSGSNEDPAHEKAESAAREAQEHESGSQGGSSPTPSTSSSGSASQE